MVSLTLIVTWPLELVVALYVFLLMVNVIFFLLSALLFVDLSVIVIFLVFADFLKVFVGVVSLTLVFSHLSVLVFLGEYVFPESFLSSPLP